MATRKAVLWTEIMRVNERVTKSRETKKEQKLSVQLMERQLVRQLLEMLIANHMMMLNVKLTKQIVTLNSVRI